MSTARSMLSSPSLFSASWPSCRVVEGRRTGPTQACCSSGNPVACSSCYLFVVEGKVRGLVKRLTVVMAAVGIVILGCTAAAHSLPDARIGFVRFFEGHSRVFTIIPDGTRAVRVSQITGRSNNPEFSSDGTALAYDHSFSVYVVNSDGTGRRLLVRNGYEPTWWPNGDKLLFSRYRVDNDVAICSINADGTGRTELTNGSINYEPAWSPDGSKIVFVRDRDLPQLWTMDADGSRETRLTRAPGKEDVSPEWSPNGAKVLFTRSKSYGRRCLYRTDVLVINVDGSEVTNLTKTCRRRELSPHWSPDGSKIVFTRGTTRGFQIFMMNSNGTGVRRLTDGPRRNHSPVWSPDGSKIAFISTRGGNRELYIMNADGTAETRLTRTRAIESQPMW